MKSLQSIADYSDKHPASVTIGSFDGVHLGHQKVLEQLKKNSAAHQTKSVVICFDPHPRIFFDANTDLRLLNTNKEKIELLEKQQIDYFILEKFTKDFADQEPEIFIRALIKHLNMKYLLIGYDHQFGKNRNGNFEHIKALEQRLGFKTIKIDALKEKDLALSSTKIRQTLQNGDIEHANKYLGYCYFISGKVVQGNMIGRKLSFPTANIDISNKYKLIPKNGVYIVRATINRKNVYGMMNIGYRPTIDGKKLISEVHFFDFDQDIYEQEIDICFLHRMRDEQKFNSLDALKKQLQADKKNALEWLDINRLK